MQILIPSNYYSELDWLETQDAINRIELLLQENLCDEMKLLKVISPILTEKNSGMQDDLSGSERPVEFDVPVFNKKIQILQDNCKWRRMIINKHLIQSDYGICSVIPAAIRRDENELDNLHTLVLRNLTWEKEIKDCNRNIEYVVQMVMRIVYALYRTQEMLVDVYPELQKYITKEMCDNIKIISTYELEEKYPSLSPRERENAFAKIHPLFCLTQIGNPLKNGKPHDFRAPDYDDWNLNYDLFLYYSKLNCAVEIAGGGIRVTGAELRKQLSMVKWNHSVDSEYHRKILSNSLVQTIGGAIGLDRIKMILLNKVHIGEVSSSVWDEKTFRLCKANGIELL